MSAAATQQHNPLSNEVAISSSAAGLGRITLCRERQLNALGAEHVEAIRAQLLQWGQPGSATGCVLLESRNERSFCSGRDEGVKGWVGWGEEWSTSCWSIARAVRA
jgi:enoyl-CoA hydratase/carnithine racemase